MDPGEILKTEIQKALPSFGTIRKTAIYKVMGESVHNPTTGRATRKVLARHSLDVIIGSTKAIREDEIDVRETALFSSLDLPIEPNIGDFLEKDGIDFRIINFQTDPAKATWKLFIRPNKDAT